MNSLIIITIIIAVITTVPYLADKGKHTARYEINNKLNPQNNKLYNTYDHLVAPVFMNIVCAACALLEI